MTPFWRRLADRLLGRGDSAVTVPAMDGALQPNTLLDEARVLETVPEPDNLVAWQGELLYTSGADIRRAGQDEPLYRLPAPAASLAAWHDETLLAGLEDGSLLVCAGPHEGRHHVRWQAGRPMVCPTALWLQDARTVLVAEGSSRNGPADWQLDLMQKNALGSVWRLDLDTGQATLLADRLAWPAGLAGLAGLADAGDAGVLVSESWRHRLIGLSGQPGTSASEVLGDLPAYPGRISPSPQGGFWLALYAPRSQLVELVLRETRYRNDMLRELERDHWICPALSGKRSFREPLQRGGLKQMGILKPWAPSRSYGLALYLDAGLNPMHGKHSRADGQRHGITSLLEQHGVLYATSRGGHMILAMEP